MISIILCTYNDAEFLTTAIPSCVNQDIEKEIILVDDCSSKPIPDTVVSMVRDFGVKYMRNPQNMGLSASRNNGIAAAKYDLVIPLDADDWFYPNALPKLAAEITDADVCYGKITDSGNVCYPVREAFTKEIFIRDNPLFCSSLFRKKMWEKVSGYMVRKGAHYEDWNFWARAWAAGHKFKYVDVLVYNHTSRPDSMLRTLHHNRDFYRKLATEGVFDR